ncbi:trehalose-phosphatase [Geomobilimonas luticola]|uniref:Trehalose 6-phosphate phosphatase n=1 Tax=Geomobilimonas luticola TaxID=1114878 RepID=A0ABS5SDI2_9BACT|nr:trehalose-phosphatase [Geomobilimonas luticola]MBT0653433.1 trehalose-phosphatase [Geomobilimonas luticola]
MDQERLWIFDFDGTLSPLVPDRERAQLHPECKRLLEALASLPHQRVAVLSSRSLEDLISRVPIEGVYLGGGSGIEWYFPDGRHIMSDGNWAERLSRTRGSLLHDLDSIAVIPGVELEDKKWSVALHTRNATLQAKEQLYSRIISWRPPHPVRIFSGPEVLEIQLFPEVDKAFGVRMLCQILNLDLSSGTVVYAGDDENDAVAMRWVIHRGGNALMVGSSFPVAGAQIVKDHLSLVEQIRRMVGLDVTIA